LIDLVERVRRLDRPHAAFVEPLRDGEEAAVGRDFEGVGVAEAPGVDLELTAVGVAAIDHARALLLTGDDLAPVAFVYAAAGTAIVGLDGAAPRRSRRRR
jgi:hypothetical protein